MYLSIEAHADILCEDGILEGCLVSVLAVEQFGTAPLGGAVFLAGPPVLPGGAVEHHGEAVDQQGSQHKFGGMRRPADGKGPLQQFAETAHEVKDSHTLLIAGGQEGRQIEDRQGERRPQERAYGVVSTHRAAPSPLRSRRPVPAGRGMFRVLLPQGVENGVTVIPDFLLGRPSHRNRSILQALDPAVRQSCDPAIGTAIQTGPVEVQPPHGTVNRVAAGHTTAEKGRGMDGAVPEMRVCQCGIRE